MSSFLPNHLSNKFQPGQASASTDDFDDLLGPGQHSYQTATFPAGATFVRGELIVLSQGAGRLDAAKVTGPGTANAIVMTDLDTASGEDSTSVYVSGNFNSSACVVDTGAVADHLLSLKQSGIHLETFLKD